MKRNLLLNSGLALLAPFPEEDAGSQAADAATGGAGDQTEQTSTSEQKTSEEAPKAPEEEIDAAREAEAAKEAEAKKEEQKEAVKEATEELEKEETEDKSEKEDKSDERVVPEKKEDYDFTIPEDVGLKDEAGDPFQFDKDDPFVAKMRDIALADGMSQKGLTEAIALYAEAQKDAFAAQTEAVQAKRQEAIEAEKAALTYKTKDGTEITAEDRVKAVLTAIEAAGGKEMVEDLSPAFVTAKATIAIEKLVGLVSEGKIGDGSGTSQNDLDGLSGEDMLYKLRS